MATLLLGLGILLVLGLLALLTTASSWACGIRRGWVEVFARHQRLVLTPASAPHVVRAMAITHRWRRFGLACGLVLGLAYAATQRRMTIDFVAMFLGWFAGAVVAEWRISALPVSGSRRTAGLSRRSISSYVSVANRAWLGVVLLVLTGSLMAAGVGGFRGSQLMPWAAWAAACLVVGGLLWVTAQRVVRRPQPATGHDLVDADDALRGHALTVLTGCTMAAGGMGSAEFVSELGQWVGGPQSLWGVAAFLVLFVSVVIGWLVASRSRPVRAVGPADTPASAPLSIPVKGPGGA